MRLSGATRKSRAPGLTSLIDVIFLLLMFFMLASTFSIYQRLDVSTGKEGVGQMKVAPLLLRVMAEEQVALAGKRMSASELLTHLEKSGIEKTRPVAILPAANSTVQDVVVAMDLLKRAGWSATLVSK